jgi:hypothetical protein
MTEPSTEELLATVLEALYDGSNTGYAMGKKALDTLAARLEAAEQRVNVLDSDLHVAAGALAHYERALEAERGRADAQAELTEQLTERCAKAEREVEWLRERSGIGWT